MKDLFLDENNKETTGRLTATRLQPPKRDQTQPISRGNRFGFRQNVVRPTTGGVMQRFSEFDNVNNNNSSNVERRSKSAATRTGVTITAPTIKPVEHANAK